MASADPQTVAGPCGSGTIQADGLRAGYGETTVLEELSFELAPQAVTTLLGPGGSGKTTLLRALGGWQGKGFWWQGELQVPGAPARHAQWQDFKEPRPSLGALIVPGPSLPSQEEAQARIRDVWKDQPEAVAALEEGLESEAPPWLARLARLTESLARQADFLLLDEPAVDMPGTARGWIEERLRQEARAATVLVVTHNLGFARSVADHAILLAAGKLIETGPSEDFFARPKSSRTRDFVRYGS